MSIFFHNIILKTRACRTCTLLDPGEMEYFMGWLIIVEKKYKLHVISEFRWPIRPMVNSLKTRVLHALEIVLDEIYCYVTFSWEGSQTGSDLAIYSLFGWLIRWAGCWSTRQVADLADHVLPRRARSRNSVVSQPAQPTEQAIRVQWHIWTSICENDLVKDVPWKCCTS